MPEATHVPSATETLPEWDLSDLYRSPDAPEVEADFTRADQHARAFATAYAGKLADLPGAALAAAIAEYEKIEEILGRLLSYSRAAYRTEKGGLDQRHFSLAEWWGSPTMLRTVRVDAPYTLRRSAW